MSDTPRTDAVLALSFNPWPRLRDLSRELERELNSANATIRQLREAITRLEAQQRGTSNAESMLCDMLGVYDGSQILDAIQGLKERIKRLEVAGDALAENADLNSECDMHAVCQWRKAKETKP